jgi:endonuclease III
LLAIFSTLRVEFGRATLAPLKAMNDSEAEHFLKGLPGVGKKVAKCVLMYSLNRQVLPVDVHTHRVAVRLGLMAKRRPDTSQDLVEAQIPPDLRYGFHVNAVAHGRAVCLPRKPMCGACVLRKCCPYPRGRKKK